MGDAERTNVIVVGAGASKEFGLPTGAELLSEIEGLADMGFRSGREFFGSHVIYKAFLSLAREETGFKGAANDHLHKAWFIRDNMALAPSIDNFLHTHKDDIRLVDTGKILLVAAIQQAERESTLFYDEMSSETSISFSRSQKTGIEAPRWSWLGELFRLLVAERDFSDFLMALERITFISFNYDRCIEHFILHAAKQYFSTSAEQLQSVNSALKVIHPYGSLGDLAIVGDRISGFAPGSNSQALVRIAKGIRTFTEGLADTESVQEIHEAFDQCDIAIFLGFGFLPLNLRLLFSNHNYLVDRVIGTSKGLSNESADTVKKELAEALVFGDGEMQSTRRSLGDGKVSLSNVTCGELFNKHNRFLSQKVNK